MPLYTDISLKEPVREIYDADVLLQRLELLLTTEPGDMIDNPTFGTPLRQFMYEPVSRVTAGLIRNSVRRSVEINLGDVFIIETIAVNQSSAGDGFTVDLGLYIREFDKRTQFIQTYN
jgi:phage baseplate assembly protein W